MAVRPKFRNEEIYKNVFRALLLSGLTMDQALDALSSMQNEGIIFGELHMPGTY